MSDIHVPAPPPFGLPPDQYGPALDAWLAELTRRCDDSRWVERYLTAVGIPLPAKVPLYAHPPRGDRDGWRVWWAHWRKTFAEAGASAEGLEYDPPPPRLDRRARRRRWRRRVAAVVREVLAAELPEAIDYLQGRESK